MANTGDTRAEEGLAATLQRISNAARAFADEFDLIPESQLYGRITSGEIQTACTNAADTLTRLQRERDEARALVEDMQGRLAELTEDVRVAREAARPPAPWRTLGQVIRGGGQP